MRNVKHVTSLAMMIFVLLLGVVIPAQPELDDGDDNVGCAAVMPLATRDSAHSTAASQPVARGSKQAAAKVNIRPVFGHAADEAVPSLTAIALSSPPLRT
jgi:hypothetical protein